MKGLGLLCVAAGAIAWFSAVRLGSTDSSGASPNAVSTRDVHPALALEAARPPMATPETEPSMSPVLALEQVLLEDESATGTLAMQPVPDSGEVPANVASDAATEVAPGPRRARIPLMEGRTTFEDDALTFIRAFAAPAAPDSRSAPRMAVGVRLFIERGETPSELAARRFAVVVRVLRRSGLWRAQVRDLGWERSETAALELTLIETSSSLQGDSP